MGRANSVRDFFLNDVRRIFELMFQQEGLAPPVRASLSVYGRALEIGD